MNPLYMIPGPSFVHEDVRKAMTFDLPSPDLDDNFFEFYLSTTKKIAGLMGTENQVFILCGEAILGLEAACASLIERNDRVLCLDNGFFGNGFKDFVEMYGGNPVMYSSDYRKEIDVSELKAFLDKDNDFKLATLVHCETPSGITNDVSLICKLLKSYGIVTVVDAVSAVGGEFLNVDEAKIDICLGGSQKCFSAPTGLTFLSISNDAWNIIDNRKSKIPSYYCNLSLFKNWYKEKYFPYTMPSHLIYALSESTNRIEADFAEKHKKIASAVRSSLTECGLELYPLNGFANTVTAMIVPQNVSFEEIYNELINSHNVFVASTFGPLKGKIIRLGHMGENCNAEKIFRMFSAMDDVFRKKNIALTKKLHVAFSEHI